MSSEDAQSRASDEEVPGGAPAAPEAAALALEDDDPPFTALNWALIAGGLVLMVVGFVLLGAVNAQATNWQAIWSPILILAGYAVVFLAILIVRRPPSAVVDDEAADPGAL